MSKIKIFMVLFLMSFASSMAAQDDAYLPPNKIKPTEFLRGSYWSCFGYVEGDLENFIETGITNCTTNCLGPALCVAGTSLTVPMAIFLNIPTLWLAAFGIDSASAGLCYVFNASHLRKKKIFYTLKNLYLESHKVFFDWEKRVIENGFQEATLDNQNLEQIAYALKVFIALNIDDISFDELYEVSSRCAGCMRPFAQCVVDTETTPCLRSRNNLIRQKFEGAGIEGFESRPSELARFLSDSEIIAELYKLRTINHDTNISSVKVADSNKAFELFRFYCFLRDGRQYEGDSFSENDLKKLSELMNNTKFESEIILNAKFPQFKRDFFLKRIFSCVKSSRQIPYELVWDQKRQGNQLEEETDDGNFFYDRQSQPGIFFKMFDILGCSSIPYQNLE